MENELMDDLEELVSAEDFLDYFAIPYDERVVKVNRLHILQRFHNYLASAKMPSDETAQRAIYLNALSHAYQDFVHSDARSEKVLKVYQRASGMASVPITQIGRS